MKKTLSINLAGRVFHIDEDAYVLLDTYLHNVGSEYTDEHERKTLILRLENQVAIMAEEGYEGSLLVLNIKTIQQILQQVSFSVTEMKDEDVCLSAKRIIRQPLRTDDVIAERAERRYYRDMDGALVCGVLSGLSAYMGWHLLVVRVLVSIVFVISVLCGLGWLLLLAYLSVWMISPPAVTASDKLRLYGRRVTIDSIARVVLEESEHTENSRRPGGSKLGCILKTALVAAAMISLVLMLLSLISVLMGLFYKIFLYIPGGYTVAHLPEGIALSTNISILVILIIPLAVLWIKRDEGRRAKSVDRRLKWFVIVIWFASIAVLLTSFILFIHNVGLGILPLLYRFVV